MKEKKLRFRYMLWDFIKDEGIAQFLLLMIILLGAWMVISGIYQDRDATCQEEGFEQHKYINEIHYCIKGNVYTSVEVDCPFTPWKECKVEVIILTNYRSK